MNFAIILAAGNSKRTKKINKIFYQIKGKPLIFYTIAAFERHPNIGKIALVARKKDFKKIFGLIKKYKFKKILAVVEGGKERQNSFFNGLRALESFKARSNDLVLSHNGANPLVSKKEISEVIKAAKKHKAALVGHFAKDTIKQTDEKNFVAKTLERKRIFLAQTPQVMEYGLAKRSLEKAFAENIRGTDDSFLVERLGKKVKVVPASAKNIKATYLEDLRFIESQL